MIPTAYQMADEYYNIMNDNYGSVEDLAKQFKRFAELHVEAALKEAASKARTKLLPEDQRTDNRTPTMWDVIINKDTILNAYSIKNIK